MRTTLTLDPDVAQLLKEEAHRLRLPFKAVVNGAIRRGLAPGRAEPPGERFQVRPHRTTLRPGIETGSLNRLADELEEEAAVRRLGSSR